MNTVALALTAVTVLLCATSFGWWKASATVRRKTEIGRVLFATINALNVEMTALKIRLENALPTIKEPGR